MTDTRPSLLIETDMLEDILYSPDILIVDLGKADTYSKLHIPGAVFVDYSQIVAVNRPAMGLLPDDATLRRVFSSLGIEPDSYVVAYDDEGGGRAARFLWTLEVAGHTRFSLLNGGLHAWANEGHPYDDAAVTPTPSAFVVAHNGAPVADSAYIRARLGNAEIGLLDVRSAEEFTGGKRYAERGGHIPGAVNLEWTMAMDQTRNLRFKPDEELERLLSQIGITPDREIITYCQSHHRSAHTYIVLRHLGFPRVKGYPGSWSDWGNNPDLPVEQ
jgi:thiosulfate/3-mercaptopyruvate sulfurtransferase